MVCQEVRAHQGEAFCIEWAETAPGTFNVRLLNYLLPEIDDLNLT